MKKINLKESQIFWMLGLVSFFVFFGLMVVFLKINGKNGSYIFTHSPFSYFSWLASSFLEGRLDVTPVNGVIHDLSQYKGKYYLYWPPAPAVILTPFVYLFGINLPDRLISIILSALNFTLIMFVIRRLSDFFGFSLKTWTIILLSVFWSFGTVNFSVGFEGSVWYISQVFSLTFLIASFYFFLAKNPKYLLSGLFFTLAVYTRNTMVFTGLVYLYLIFLQQNTDWKKSIISALKFGSLFIAGSFLYLWYNYARFDNAFDNGLAKHNMGWWYREGYEKYGYFNTHFIPNNLYYEWFKMPDFINNFPFIGFTDLKGFGMFWASSVLVLLVLLVFNFKKSERTEYNIFNVLNLLNIGIVLTLITMIMGRGVQFGARYSLDYYISIMFLLVFVFHKYQENKFFKTTFLILLLISVYINTVGAYYMAIRW
ncbi:MAG: glycosyltransferase family 39 protein [Bacteroidetes bacterium]|nr:glycosyltransferase family 39 protein [Bacteroidota bacterium]